MYWAMKEKLILKRNSAISCARDRSKKDERIYNYYYLYLLLLFLQLLFTAIIWSPSTDISGRL